MTRSKGKKRPKPDSSSIKLTPFAAAAAPSERCWKCKGTGLKFQKETQLYDGPPCNVCGGEGIRMRSKRSKALASAPGKILNLRGYPDNHPFRTTFRDGFAGPRAVWGRGAGNRRGGGVDDAYGVRRKDNDSEEPPNAYGYLPSSLRPRAGEVVGSLGCGDWRIYQIADGNKLTVDDFVCAWVAAEEMRKRGYGARVHRENIVIRSCDGNGDGENQKIFGGKSDAEMRQKIGHPVDVSNTRHFSDDTNRPFNHADIGTGCGSVLMMTAWAFLGEIRSIGVEAQSISFDCVRRALKWNLGRDGTSSEDTVQIRQNDLRNWDGCGVSGTETPKSGGETVSTNGHRAPYQLITGTPPYFPLDSFVASQNHEQKVRCRVPTRGGAPDYIATASRFLLEESCDEDGVGSEGVFCMVEAAFDKAKAGVLQAAKKHGMRVRRRIDVVTRVGLPPRFSCWVMTKKSNSETNKATPAVSTMATDGEANGNEGNKTESNNTGEKNTEGKDGFPIETLTLRNADLTRTEEYTNAMEIMGWVDFEKFKSKREKSLNEVVTE